MVVTPVAPLSLTLSLKGRGDKTGAPHRFSKTPFDPRANILLVRTESKKGLKRTGLKPDPVFQFLISPVISHMNGQ